MLLSAKHYAGITSTSESSLTAATSVEIRTGYQTSMNAILEAHNCQNVAFSIFFLNQNVFKEILNSSNTNAVMFNTALRV